MKVPRRRIWRMLLLILGTSLCVGGSYAWYLDSRQTPGIIPIDNTTAARTTNSPIPEDLGEELSQRLDAIQQLVAQLRQTPEKTSEMADALMALGHVLCDLRQYDAARQAYGEVQNLCGSDRTWQAGEAIRRLAAIDRWSKSGDAERILATKALGLHREALRQFATGDYAPAIAAAQSAVAMRRQLIPRQRLADAESADGMQYAAAVAELADSIHLLGRLCLEHGDYYNQAESLLSEARDLMAQSLGVAHPEYANCLRSLAVARDDRGEFTAADALYQQALDIHRAARGEMHLDYARTLARQGHMHLTWWKDYAGSKISRALYIRERLVGQNHLECAESFEDLGRNALNLLDYVKSEELFRRAWEIRRVHQGADHPDTAETRSGLARCLSAAGDHAQERVLQKQTLEITVRARGRQHRLVGRYVQNRGGLSLEDWDINTGKRACRRALEIYRNAGTLNHPDALLARYIYGWTYYMEYFAFNRIRHVSPQPAEDALVAAVKAYEEVPGGTELPEYPDAILNQAGLYYWDNHQLKDHAFARELARKALKNIQANGNENHPYYPDYFYTLSRWYQSQGQYDKAIPLIERHVKLIEKRFGAALVGRRLAAYMALAGAYMHEGANPDAMWKTTGRVLDFSEQLFARNAAGQADVDRLFLADRRGRMIGVRMSVSELANRGGEMYREILGVRGAASACQTADRLAHNHAELRLQLQMVQSARQKLAQAAFHPPQEGRDRSAWVTDLVRLVEEKDDEERTLAVASRPFLPAEKPLEVADLQAILADDVAFIDFLKYEHIFPPPDHHGRMLYEFKLVAFVVRRDGQPECIRLGPAAAIDEAVSAWRQELLQSPGAGHEALDKAADEVARLVWQPIELLLKGARTLLIAPDGPLCFLPFAALPGRNPGTYLLEDFAISYIPSGRQLCDLRKAASVINEGLLAVGDVEYGTAAASRDFALLVQRGGLLPDKARWRNLPASGEEVEQVVDLFRQVGGDSVRDSVLRRREATVDHMVAALRQKWRYLHFAGHGFFADRKAGAAQGRMISADSTSAGAELDDEFYAFGRVPLLLSGLVLAPEQYPARPGDAILTAEEVGSLDLRGTELVVLSACETGLGNTAGGEGVLGLQRAFFSAGARSTVTSLWSVDDAATSVLMEQFYKNLWRTKLPKAEALRQAQLFVLHRPQAIWDQRQLLAKRGILPGEAEPLADDATPKSRPADPTNNDHQSLPQRSHPASWAAFVLYGDAR